MRPHRLVHLLLAAIALLAPRAAAQAAPTPTAEDVAFYQRQVEPILARHCYRCHGTRGREVRGELWLRARQNVLRGGHSGPVVDLVEPEKSRLLRYVRHEDEEHRMPPDEKLADADLDALAEWVRRGVPMPELEGEWVYEPPDRITEAARRFWSFQPIADPQPPAVRDAAWCRSEVDRFVLARLEAAGLAPNGEADRVALLRRATYDLTGLPPTLAEIDAFAGDASPDAYERVVDRLLASPHYGERWGRHWLDLVRFAETNGYERDGPKPEVWRYRQYVIDAFNADKPYDRFVLEQLAGDELDDADAESITATGYYRLGPWDDEPADAEQAVLDGLDDIVATTGEVFLGLTMGCARCHDHKLDPIPQADYYRMLAFFHNVRPYSKEPGDITTDVATAAEAAAGVERHVLGVRERDGEPPVTHVMRRGSARAPGEAVQPGFPRILGGAEPEIRARPRSSGRRLAFARWLVAPDHPLTARVIANRVWQFHFGRGLVRSPSDFGMQGRPPTHPELLDWLARTLVADGFRLKALHRRLMLSSTYRMSSAGRERARRDDPANDLLWRFEMRRLSAEEVRDSVLAVSGALDLEVGGRSVFPAFPSEVLAGQSRVTWTGDDSVANNTRRTVYTCVKRSLLDPLVESFDAATTDASCPVRFQTTQPTQALTMLNSAFVHAAAARMAERLRDEAGPNAREQVALALRLATGRLPAEDRLRIGVEFLQSFPGPGAVERALPQLCLIALSLNEFLFVD